MGDAADLYDEAYENFDEPVEATCKHCGKRGLYWSKRGAKWYLVDEATAEQHACSEKALARKAMKEFDDLS